EIEGASVGEIVERVVSAHETRTASTVLRSVEDDHSDPSAAVKICVYRFVQEALNNAYRHGGGIEQSVTARVRDGEVRIEVRDQGDGFDPN
ncbi:ATP-binding protein, partial [Chryseobacterium sp. SIMBA_029]|uniref:ATP-binding protein n=1 Tax=Chryseobacterium sp. SIMBA_029 TaxID=3085772 RepID=UPI003978B243